MEINPADAPHNCPGTENENAGKADPCKGCPNQIICSSGEARKELDVSKILSNFKDIKHILLVMSGKGGVGKSTVSSNLARIIATDENLQVGIMDIDLCGPSIPQMMNVAGEKVHQSGSGWSPIYADENLSVMSIAFLLDSLDDAVIWRGPKKNALIKQFLEDVDWGPLDYLIIDTPPGTSDEHISIFTYLKKLNIDGAIIVTTPQEVALLDVRKQINFCRKTRIPILGVVENMGLFTCPKCHQDSTIFPPSTGGVANLCKEMHTLQLTTIPLDPLLGKTCDAGESIFAEYPDSSTVSAYETLYKNLKTQLCKEIVNC